MKHKIYSHFQILLVRIRFNFCLFLKNNYELKGSETTAKLIQAYINRCKGKKEEVLSAHVACSFRYILIDLINYGCANEINRGNQNTKYGGAVDLGQYQDAWGEAETNLITFLSSYASFIL